MPVRKKYVRAIISTGLFLHRQKYSGSYFTVYFLRGENDVVVLNVRVCQCVPVPKKKNVCVCKRESSSTGSHTACWPNLSKNERTRARSIHHWLPQATANGNGWIVPIEVTLRAATPVNLPAPLWPFPCYARPMSPSTVFFLPFHFRSIPSTRNANVGDFFICISH